MMVNGIMSGAILSWVTLITELSSSIILYSSKTITLNLGVYIMVSRGTDGKACAISTILTVMTDYFPGIGYETFERKRNYAVNLQWKKYKGE